MAETLDRIETAICARNIEQARRYDYHLVSDAAFETNPNFYFIIPWTASLDNFGWTIARSVKNLMPEHQRAMREEQCMA